MQSRLMLSSSQEIIQELIQILLYFIIYFQHVRLSLSKKKKKNNNKKKEQFIAIDVELQGLILYM